MQIPPGAVAVVVASRDRREQLARSLPRHLSLPERPRVVLVDDASSDGTSELVRRRFPGVQLVRLERSRGGAARNAGLRAVRERYVALCDDDSWFAPGALARAAALLDRHPALAVVNAHVLVGPYERDDPVCVEMRRTPLPPAEGQPGYPILSFIACGVVVRREAVLDAGGFCERLRVGGEEELLGWDLAAAGWQMSYVPEIVAHHHPPPNDGRLARRERELRNALWSAWLRRPARAAAGSTVRKLRRAPAGIDRGRVLARTLAGLPWVLRERRVGPPHVETMRALLDERGNLAGTSG